jgi:hypothetical protein
MYMNSALTVCPPSGGAYRPDDILQFLDVPINEYRAYDFSPILCIHVCERPVGNHFPFAAAGVGDLPWVVALRHPDVLHRAADNRLDGPRNLLASLFHRFNFDPKPNAFQVHVCPPPFP